MKRSTIISIIVVAIVILIVIVSLSGGPEKFVDNITSTFDNKTPQSVPTTPSGNVIEITSSGFSPETITIGVGETVTWINKKSGISRPATDIHPTHFIYPGSDIKKCGTVEAESIFDACRILAQEETYEFTFNEEGSWRYHDHLNPRTRGTIIVE